MRRKKELKFNMVPIYCKDKRDQPSSCLTIQHYRVYLHILCNISTSWDRTSKTKVKQMAADNRIFFINIVPSTCISINYNEEFPMKEKKSYFHILIEFIDWFCTILWYSLVIIICSALHWWIKHTLKNWESFQSRSHFLFPPLTFERCSHVLFFKSVFYIFFQRMLIQTP